MSAVRAKYLISLIDQGVLSLFSFVLGFILVRGWEPEQFGLFVFWRGFGFFCVGLQNALVTTPLNVFVPAAKDPEERLQTERILSTVNVAMVVGVFAAIAAYNFSFPVLPDDPGALPLIIALFVAGRLVMEYGRSLHFGRQQPGRVLQLDTIYLLFAGCIPVFYLVVPEFLLLEVVLGVLAFAAVTSGIISLAFQGGQGAVPFRWVSFNAYRPYWTEGRWSLTGVLSTEAHSRGYVYLVTAMSGLEALGTLAAARMLFGPIGLFVTAWGRTARPHLARAASEGGRAEISRFVTMALGSAVIGLSLLFTLLYLAWLPLRDFIYGSKYEAMEFLVVGWAFVAAIGVVKGIFSISLQSMKAFKPLALATVYSGTGSLILITVVVLLFGYRQVVTGVLIGDMALTGYLIVLYLRRLKTI